MREYGSEHPGIILPDGYFDSFYKMGREVIYLRSGRESLLFVSRNCKFVKHKVILMPAYCCWSMSAPFEKDGWKILYYRLNEDLTVDLDYLRELLEKEPVEAVLTMNFYGSASTDDAVTLVKAHNKEIKVIEDFSHCTFSIGQIFNLNVDYYVSSIRKSIGVCDGAVVLSKDKMGSQFIDIEDPDFANRRAIAQILKGRYSYSNNQGEKLFFLEEIRVCESIINEFLVPRPISDRAKQMLTLINGEEIAYARRENMKHLVGILQGKVKMIPGLERCFDGAPFSLPILVDNRDDLQRNLAQKGVYAPVLWPICKEARDVCSVSTYISDHMLSIPIDQRYNWNDMEEISSIILACI